MMRIQILMKTLDPKMFWALNNLQYFPMEINKASKEELLRIPGLGIRSVLKILKARKFKKLDFYDLKQLKISIKKAQYFITCKGKYQKVIPMYKEKIKTAYLNPPKLSEPSLFDIDYSKITGEL
jgi:predicted DNA-binding helix-hairpin-helix protein